jgi:hypothetical protein
MNALGPPKKAPGELASKTGRKLLTNSGNYHTLLPLQPLSWALEAERLAEEFRRTHQVQHLQALARHLDGVFERLSAERATR